MCPVVDGTPVDAATTNPEFLDAVVDDQAQGKIDFINSSPASGPSVINIQRETNSLNSFTGRTSGSAYNTTPTYSENQGFTPANNLKDRASELSGKFNNSTGHRHNGLAGEGVQISGPDLVNVPLAGYFQQGVSLTGVTGGTTNVSTEMTGKNPSAGSTSVGVVITAPYNKIVIRQGSGPNEDDQYVDGSGNVVYARLTEALSVWTLTYYVDIAGVETAYSFTGSNDVKWYYQELYNPMINPPVYSDLAMIPSDNPTQDILDATTSAKGKVQLATTVQPISATGSAGTGNATVANADHTHEGVHGIKIDGDPTVEKGDVTFKAGTNVTLAWVSNKLEVSTNGAVGYQETPAGTVDGVNASFGPLTFVPSDSNSVLVMVDFVPVPLTTGYTISGSNITFQAGWIPQLGQNVYVFYLTAGIPAVPVMSGTFRVEYRTITVGEATAKSLALAFSPSTASYVMLDIIGGGPQEYSVDYTVSGSNLSWLGLALDGVLSSGDKLRISYVT